jgi:formylglycine-generating enzyme required for sulfatase activity
MDSTEVTNSQFKSVMGYLYVDPGNPVLPVLGVTWNEAIIYCNELSVKAQLDPVYIYPQKVKDSYGRWTIAGNFTIDYTKKGFRLPTEAEWEFACRAGSDQPFYWNARSGNQFLDDTASLYAWYLYNTGLSCQVGTKKPNAWGLYDMVGNALEWCNDWYDATYYRTSPVSNPAGPQTGAMRVLRGGCYVNSITEMQMPVRFNGYPNNKNTDGSDETFWLTRGFRTVLPQ